MNAFELPRAVAFGGREWAVNTDFRDVLLTLQAFEDPELTNEEKAFVCLHNTFVDYAQIPRELLQEAYDAAMAFIDHGGGDGKNGPRTMDWSQDADIIFAAVNRVAGREVREAEHLHWWTFMGYFMEIKDTTASMVFSLRQKKARGKTLEKWEKDYWNQNRALCQLKTKLTDAEMAEKKRLKEILGG